MKKHYLFISTALLFNAAIAQTLDAPIAFAVKGAPISFVKADVDGDSKMDIVSSCYFGGTQSYLSVLRNTTTGAAGDAFTSTSFTETNYKAINGKPGQVAVGDLNGDNKPDAIIAQEGSAYISIFKNTSTSGNVSFSAYDSLNTSAAGSLRVAIADMDGDGKNDIVLTLSNKKVMVARNTSTGGAISFATPITYSTGANIQALGVADFDGDGKKDVVASMMYFGTQSSPFDSLYIFRNTSTSGTITLVKQANHPIGGSFSGSTFGFDMGDVDKDGKIDLVGTMGTNTNGVGGFRNTSTSGNFSFTTIQFSATNAGGNFYPGLADINLDGYLDVLMPYFFNLKVVPHVGTSGMSNTTYSNTGIVQSSFINNGTTLYGAMGADFNGDNKADVAVSSNSGSEVVIFRNTTVLSSVKEAGLLANFNVSPNPTQEKSVVNFNLNKATNIQISLFDITGKQVMNIANNNFSVGAQQISFDVNGLNNGIYFCRIVADNQQNAVIKVVVNK